MSELNQLLPEVLLAYVANIDCVLSPEKCNELSKLVSQLETKNEMLLQERQRETTRVRCTADGEYPEDDITVLAEFHGVDFADIPHIVWFEWDNAQWVDFLTEEFVPNVPEEMTVYWKPLTSLKDEYEREKDGE